MSYGVVIPNRYPDTIRPLLDSMRTFGPDARVVIIADNHQDGYGYERITYNLKEFQFAISVNMGIRYLCGLDIILLNDDCVLVEPVFDKLASIAKLYPTVGILSPLIRGCAGNPLQRYHEYNRYWHQYESIKFVWGQMPICFPCVYLKREMLDQIGLLDETIMGYGNDDTDLCLRARSSSWVTAITSEIVVQHGTGGRELAEGRGKTWSVSFARRYPMGTIFR